jgi:hypothetical protein
MLKKPSNKPRAEIVALATRAVAESGGPTLARAWFKFDCGACGSREIAPEPNVLPESATCAVCGETTRLVGAGMALQIRRDTSVNWDTPGPGYKTLLVRKDYASDKGDA